MRSNILQPTLTTPIADQKLGADNNLVVAPRCSSKPLSNTAIFLLFSVLLLLCYLPVVIGYYGCADDFVWVAGAIQHDMQRMQILQIVQGRPIMALLFTLGFSPMTSVGDLRFLRLFSIITVACLAFGIYRTLVLAKHSRPAAFFLALVMCMMPPFQVFVSWAATAFYAMGALVAGMALLLADRAYLQTEVIARYRLALAATLVLLAALLIFQPSAMFYWVFAAILLFKPDASFADIWRRFVWYSGICIVAMGVAFGICQLGRIHFQDICPLPHRRSHLTADPWGKCLWFFNQPLMTCLNFGWLFPKWRLALDVAIFIVSGLILYTRGKISTRVGQILLAVSIIPLSYLPNLVIEENWASYRTECALGSIIVLYTFLALLGFRQTVFRSIREPLFLALIGTFAFATMTVAFSNTLLYFVVPNSLEFSILRGQLNKTSRNSLTFKQVAMNDPTLLLPPMNSYWLIQSTQEFGCPSSPIQFAQKSMEYLLRRSDP